MMHPERLSNWLDPRHWKCANSQMLLLAALTLALALMAEAHAMQYSLARLLIASNNMASCREHPTSSSLDCSTSTSRTCRAAPVVLLPKKSDWGTECLSYFAFPIGFQAHMLFVCYSFMVDIRRCLPTSCSQRTLGRQSHSCSGT